MLTNLATVRSYAKAIFAVATCKQQFTVWQNALTTLALVVRECQKKNLLNNPKITSKQKLPLFCSVIKDFPAANNLVYILAEHRKLELLPEINAYYKQLLLEHEQTLEAKVITAYELTIEQKEKLSLALQQRYQRKILLRCQLDTQLIGGAVVHIANQVIDGSVKGMLQRLKQELIF
jgi:F-type H+-transporting ATPase subunit delta